MMPGENRRVSFDGIASKYEDTRGLPGEVSQKVSDALCAFLPEQAKILEVGVGTGRIVRPLLSRGIRVFGVDISTRMMARFLELIQNGVPRPQLIQADACQLPFQNKVFQAVIAIHVFHLIREWQLALSEMQRVLQPGGLFGIGYDWRDLESPHSQINDQWRQIISKFIDHPGHPGLRDFSRASRILLDTGAQMEEIEAAAWEYIFCPAVYIQQIEDGTFSYSWRLDPELMPACIAELRTWAIERFGSLEVEFTLPKKFIWQIYYWR